jgi:hypothetical protein
MGPAALPLTTAGLHFFQFFPQHFKKYCNILQIVGKKVGRS